MKELVRKSIEETKKPIGRGGNGRSDGFLGLEIYPE